LGLSVCGLARAPHPRVFLSFSSLGGLRCFGFYSVHQSLLGIFAKASASIDCPAIMENGPPSVIVFPNLLNPVFHYAFTISPLLNLSTIKSKNILVG